MPRGEGGTDVGRWGSLAPAPIGASLDEALIARIVCSWAQVLVGRHRRTGRCTSRTLDGRRRGGGAGVSCRTPACVVSDQYPGHADPASRAGVVREGEEAAAAKAAGFWHLASPAEAGSSDGRHHPGGNEHDRHVR